MSLWNIGTLHIPLNFSSAVSDNRNMEQSQFDILNGHMQHCKGTFIQLTFDVTSILEAIVITDLADTQPRYDGTASMVLYVSTPVIKMVIELG